MVCPFEIDDPKVPDGRDKYMTKRKLIEEYEKWVQKQMNRLKAEMEAMLKSAETEKVA
jgi:predicted transcriptional regulator